jgi:hypothetical protein
MCKDGVFRLQCSGSNGVARMYQDKRYINFKLGDLRYLMNMLHIVQARQADYIVERGDVRAYTNAALGTTEFVEPNSTTTSTGLIPYGQLFDELKTPLF